MRLISRSFRQTRVRERASSGWARRVERGLRDGKSPAGPPPFRSAREAAATSPWRGRSTPLAGAWFRPGINAAWVPRESLNVVSSFLVCAADRGPVGKASRPRVTDTCAAASSVTFRGLGVSLSPSRADERKTSPTVKHSPPGSSAFYWESGDRLSVRTSKTSPAAQLAQPQSVRSLSPSPRRPGHQDPFAEDISSEAEEEAASRRRRVGVACTPRVVVGKGVDDHVQARWKAFRTSGYGLLAKTSPKKLSTQAEGVRAGVVASDGDSDAKPQPDLAGNASASGREADSASDNAAPEVEQRGCERQSLLHPAGDVSQPRSVREAVRSAVRRELREKLSWRAGDRGLSVAEDSSSAAPCVREREAARAAAVESEHERRQRIRAAYTPQAVRARAEEERDVQRRRDTARLHGDSMASFNRPRTVGAGGGRAKSPGKRVTSAGGRVRETDERELQWQETAVDLIRSLMDNMVTTRSIEVKRRCMQSIETEVAKLAYDSAILHRERMRYDETAESSLMEMERMDKENRHLRAEVEGLEERIETLDKRYRETQGKLAEAERQVQKLSLEEGCRERLVQAVRQLEEETQAKAHAEMQVRGQMERIAALTAEREEMVRELERERADKAAAQAALSEAHGKNYEFGSKLGANEHEKHMLLAQVSDPALNPPPPPAPPAPTHTGTAESTCAHAHTHTRTRTRTRTTVRTQVADLEASLEALRGKYSKAMAATEELSAVQEKSERQAEDLRKLRAQEAEAAELRLQVKDVTAQLRRSQEELERERAKLTRAVTHAEDRAAQLERELGHLEEKVAGREHDNARLTATAAAHVARIEELTAQVAAAQAQCEDLKRKQAASAAAFEKQVSELAGQNRRWEDDNRRLEEQNRLAGFQFQKLGEESSRLLSACEVERDLRSNLEAALHLDMHAKACHCFSLNRPISIQYEILILTGQSWRRPCTLRSARCRP